MTPAQAEYDKLIKAMRQGGISAAVRKGDLADVATRLVVAARKHGVTFGDDASNLIIAAVAAQAAQDAAKATPPTAAPAPFVSSLPGGWTAAPSIYERDTSLLVQPAGQFGFDVFHPIDSARAWASGLKSLKDCLDLITNYGVWIQELGPQWDAVQYQWGQKSPEGRTNFYASLLKLQNDWKAAIVAFATKTGLSNPQSYADTPTASIVQTTSNITDLGSTAAQAEYDQLLAAAQEFTALKNELQAGVITLGIPAASVPAFSAPIQPKPDVNEDFYKLSDPNAPGVLGGLSALGGKLAGAKPGEGGATPGGPHDWWLDPFSNPWVVGGAVVIGIGVVGWTLGQVRALVPVSR